MPVGNDFDPAATARLLLRTSRFGALATLQADAVKPFCSLVNLATMPDASPILLISRLAEHTKNILIRNAVSLMVSAQDAGDPLAAPRISLVGTAELVAEETARATARRRYLAAHPSSEVFVDFGDFAFYRIAIERAHLVAGFGRIVDLGSEQVLTDISDAGALLASEDGAVAHMNADHQDALALYAGHFAGVTGGNWRCIGIDPEGLDMRDEAGRGLRVIFPRRIVAPGALRSVLKELADDARQQNRKPN